METLGNELPSAQDAKALEENWVNYLAKLQSEDPEEYRLLMEEMQNFGAKQQQEQPEIALRPTVDSNENDPAADFSPVLPGGKQKLGKEGVTVQHESQEVKPTPGFVIKTTVQGGDKVFINVCQSPLLQKMGPKKILLEDGTEEERMNIPLSLGPPREDIDNKGKPCTVYDIIVHPTVVDNALNDDTGQARYFLCDLAFQYVEQKYKVKLDPRYKLPRLKYKGDSANPPTQFIRKESKPKIEEVDQPTKVTATNQKPSKQAPRQHARYALTRILGNQSSDEQCERVQCSAEFKDPTEQPEHLGTAFELRIHVPDYKPDTLINPVADDDVTSWMAISASSQFVQIKFRNLYHPIELFLPSPIEPESAKASYSPKDMHVTVQFPIDKLLFSEECCTRGPDPGSRAWLLASALEGSSMMRNEDKPAGPEVDSKEAASPESDALPEDRFHRSDMMSQHIKDERERQQQQKLKESEEKEKLEKAQADKKAALEAAQKRKDLIEAAKIELQKQSCIKDSTNEQTDDNEEVELDLF